MSPNVTHSPTLANSLAARWLLPLGLVLSAFYLSQLCAAEPAAKDVTALEQMRAAHDGRAVWRNFPGFEASIKAYHAGEVVAGRLIVSADGELNLQLPAAEKQEWLERAVDSLIGHRLADSEAIRQVEYADTDAQHPMGRLIRSTEAGEHSLWRVQGDVLTEVHRFNDQTHFVISVADVARTTDGKHLPQDFTVETWDRATGKLLKSRQVHTNWTRVGEFDLPTDWWAVVNTDGEQRAVDRIELTEHRLFAPATTTAIENR